MIKKNLFSIIVALVILYLSLASSDTFKEIPLINIPNIDKIIHFLMYFGFMSVITFENRRFLKNSKQIFLIALIPLFYGILMELLQLTLTVSRSGSFYDAVFNSFGILISILLWLVIKPYIRDTPK
jgi:VanZ family protein